MKRIRALCQKARLAGVFLVALSVISAFAFVSLRAQNAMLQNGLPSASDAGAIAELKKGKQYHSLMDAVRAAEGKAAGAQVDDAIGQANKLLAGDAATADSFGISVAVAGDIAVVGSYLEDTTPNTDSGAAYVFVRNGTAWTQEAKLTATDAASGDQFGVSVAISGTTIVIGAFTEDSSPNTDNGAVYVFTRSGTIWTQMAKLVASDAASSAQFGNSVAIAGNTIVAGAHLQSTVPNTNQGAAYVFTGSGSAWAQQAKLLATGAASSDNFGVSVGISGDTIVVGARFETTAPESNQGAAYVFFRNGTSWTQTAKLLASDAQTSDNFGVSVGISGETIVVGAHRESSGGYTANGAAYVFRKVGAGWPQQAKLSGSDASDDAEFGVSVAISGQAIVVGSRAAAAYLFVLQGSAWSAQPPLRASDGLNPDQFGGSVTIWGANILIGASGEDTFPNVNNGAAYVFRFLSDSWMQEGGRIVAMNRFPGDAFGDSVAISGDTAIVGTPQNALAGPARHGAAYIFVRSGTSWSLQQQLDFPGDPDANVPGFGESVAIYGDTVIVGAPGDDISPQLNDGSAYVFTRSGTTWTLQQQLLASDFDSNDSFGTSVAIYRNTVVASAPGRDAGTQSSQGALYVFTRSGTTWTQQQRLLASDGVGLDSLGSDVAIDGDTIVAGTYRDDVGMNENQGSAYVFTRQGGSWSEQAHLFASDGVAGDFFGWDVDISGNTVIVGAYARASATGGSLQGAAYIFTRTGTAWTQQAQLIASDGTAGESFGFGVTIEGDTAVVGAPDYYIFPDDISPGALYVFTRTGVTWTERNILFATISEDDSEFGAEVDISGDTIFIGAPSEDPPGELGAAYVFRNQSLPPTAATVAISGRVMTASGSGLRNAIVTLTDARGAVRMAVTSSFGHYGFDYVPSGETYIVAVSSKRFIFAPRVLTVNDNLTGVDFAPE